MTWTKLYARSRWRRRSRFHRRQNPLCARCLAEGRVREAALAHHVEEFREGMTEMHFWLGELESMCQDHHLQVHGRPAMRAYSTAIGLDGYPLDVENHPFWQASRQEVKKCKK
jgi:5-methylcytosine-specific restriction enzyme A